MAPPTEKPTVFVSHPVPQDVRDYLDTHCDCRYWDNRERMPRAQLLNEIADVQGLLEVGVRVDDELLSAARDLVIVANQGVGYNNLDVDALRQHDVLASHTPDVLDDTVADLIVGLMLGTARRIPELDAYVKAGRWQSSDNENLFGVDVHHAKLGIIGMGRIGEVVARRAIKGFDMDVYYHNRSRKTEAETELGIVYKALDDLLAESDFILLMVPLSEQTKHLIDAPQFDKMKSSAIFINASRGPTVNEEALIQALQTNRIRGAGLDVFATEPLPAGHPLTQMPQVVTVPHIGSATARTRHAMAMLAAENIVAALTGHRPPTLIPELR